MSREPFEVFDHTADVGIQAYGKTLAELFVHTAQGMESLLVSPEQVKTAVQREITVEGHDPISLLIAWLNELIFLFDTEYLLFRDFELTALSETSLTARASGEVYTMARHELGCAIKAATWHEAAIMDTAEGYTARIIFDL